jgi:ElaB/YqjD/DUF883 family membrane-anchored ribosome-binding protein
MNAHVATAIGSNGAGRAGRAAGTPFEELFDGVDDLIRRVADVENPEIRKVRANVYFALVAAQKAFEAERAFAVGANDDWVHGDGANDAGVNPAHAPAEPVAESACGELREYPGQALGVALLVGLGLGLIVSER